MRAQNAVLFVAICSTSATAAAEEVVPPAARFAIGSHVAMTESGYFHNTLKGVQVGAGLTSRDWLHVSFGRGAPMSDDDEDQLGSSGWEATVSYSRHLCAAGDVALCFLPTLAVGYQSASVTWIDPFALPGEPDVSTETLDGVFGEARAVGRALFAGHVAVDLGLGLRATQVGDGMGVGRTASAALEVMF